MHITAAEQPTSRSDGGDDETYTVVRRRRARRPREPLPQPPDRVGARHERVGEVPVGIQQLLDVLHGLGREASAWQDEDGEWRVQADLDILETLVEHDIGSYSRAE